MPSIAHIPDLIGREKLSLASQCIKTKKIQCTPIVKKTDKNNTTQTKKTSTTEETTASSAASWVYSGQ